MSKRRGPEIGLLMVVVGAACGDPSALRVSHPMDVSAEGLRVGAAADAILFQGNERASAPARVDAGSLNDPTGLTIGGDKLYVADRGNSRVLGFSDPITLSTGGTADLVLLVDDFDATTRRFVPNSERITPEGVGVDREGRVYVWSTSDVLVFEDPYGTDTRFDAVLLNVPGSITRVREIGGGAYLAVAGTSSVTFYALGSIAPISEATINNPCPGGVITDLWDTDSGLLLACSQGVSVRSSCLSSLCDRQLCANNQCTTPSTDCATPFPAPGVVVLAKDPTTGLPNSEARQAYALIRGSSCASSALSSFTATLRLAVANDALWVLDSEGNRVLRFPGFAAQVNAVLASSSVAPKTETSATTTILGQPANSFSSIAPNQGNPQGFPSANRLRGPKDLAFDSGGSLWVVDGGNARLVKYEPAPPPGGNLSDAAVFLGQSSSDLGIPNRLDASSVLSVGGVAIHPTNGRVYVSDPVGHRVLVFDDITSVTTGAPALLAIGQPSEFSAYENYDGSVNQNGSAPSATGLSTPTYLAIDSITGFLYVNDSGNRRVLVYENPESKVATRATGDALTQPVRAENTLVFGALAVHGGQLFVAVGSAAGGAPTPAVFRYDVSRSDKSAFAAAVCPDQVLGQDVTSASSSACPIAYNLFENRVNNSDPSAVGFDKVTALDVEVEDNAVTGLWVADAGNRRVLYFKDPIQDTGDRVANSSDEATNTADAVVGQDSFTSLVASSGAERLGDHTTVAVSSNGMLWVADRTYHRVVRYPSPKVRTLATGLTRADLVLGQTAFNQSTLNRGRAETSASGFNAPVDIATDAAGQIVLVGDRNNHRVLRFAVNRSPQLTGGGEYTLAPGTSRSVEINVQDPDGDAIGPLILVEQRVPMGTLVLEGNRVTYTAVDASIGTVAQAVVSVSDSSPRASVGSASLTFRVVSLRNLPSGPGSTAGQDSESCRSVSGAAAWIVGVLGFILRARRRLRRI